MWVYVQELRKWAHPSGVLSDNPPDREPSGAETALLIAEQAKGQPQPAYTPGGLRNPVEGCGCAGAKSADQR